MLGQVLPVPINLYEMSKAKVLDAMKGYDGENHHDNTAHLIGLANREIVRFLIFQLESHQLHGIVPSHGDILAGLMRQEPLSMTDLANSIGRDRSTVTTLVRKLTSLGLVRLETNPDDSRSRLVYLTEQGRGLRESFFSISTLLAETLWAGINREDRTNFERIIKLIVNNMKSTV